MSEVSADSRLLIAVRVHLVMAHTVVIHLVVAHAVVVHLVSIHVMVANEAVHGWQFFAVAEDGSLSGSLGQVFGTGQGRGIAFLLSTMGLAVVGVTVVSWRSSAITHFDRDVPDIDTPEAESRADEAVPARA